MFDLQTRPATDSTSALSAADSSRLHGLLRLTRPATTTFIRSTPAAAWLPAPSAAMGLVNQIVPASVALYFALALLHLFGLG